MKKLNDNYSAVVVPEGAEGFSNNLASHQIDFDLSPITDGQFKGLVFNDCILLPPNHTYTIVGRPLECSEEVAEEIVNHRWSEWFEREVYEDYTRKSLTHAFSTATESLLSLLRSQGLDPANCLIIKNG